MQHNCFESPKATKVGLWESPKAKKGTVGKFQFDSTGSPVRTYNRQPSNESFEEIRRAPRKNPANMPEDRKNLYSTACKPTGGLLDFSTAASSPRVAPFSLYTQGE